MGAARADEAQSPEVAEVLDLLDDVVVQLQLHELVEADQVVNLQDVLVREVKALDLAERDDLLLHLLRLVACGADGGVVQMRERELIIGRSPELCDIQIRLPEVSKKQAKLSAHPDRPNEVWAENLSKTNPGGTQLNNEPLKQPRRLTDGDVLSVCGRNFRFEYECDDNAPTVLPGTLSTAAVRPCSAIFGPDDNFISETWIRAGALQIILPAPKIDYVHVDNVLWGHLLCEKALREKTEAVGGHAFCVNGGEPSRSADDFYAAVAHFYEQATGEAMAVTRLPTRLLRVIAFAVECYQRLTQTRLVGELGNLTPAMFATAELSYGFSSAKAKRLLGYEPLYTVDEGLQKTTAEHFKAGNCVKSNKTMWGAAAKVAPKKA